MTRLPPQLGGCSLLAASLVCAVASAAPPALSQEPPKISHLEFNCDLERCARPEEYRRFLSLTDLWVGRVFSQEAVDRAVRNLEKTEFFDRVEPFVRRDRLGVSVTLDTVGAIVVRNVEIDADWTILESDVRRRLAYRLGERLKTDELEVERQRQSLLKFLSKRGYHGSEVDIDFDIRGHEATVRVTIEVGHFYRIEDLAIAGNDHVSSFWFQIYFFQPRRFGLSGLYLPETVEAAEDDLLERYHDMGFFDARIDTSARVDADARTVGLDIRVREGTRSDVVFEGNDAVGDHELHELITFREARSADPVEVERTAKILRAAYQSRGYHFATVKTHVVRAEESGSQSLVFEIHEGPIARVEAIEFVGNKGFTDADLSEVVGTTTFNALAGRPGFALDDQLEADVAALTQHYVERGYLSASVDVAGVHARQDGEYLRVVYRVAEGPRTLIGDVRIEGVERYPRALVLEVMGLRPGSPYGPRGVLKAVAQLQRRYRADGHPHARLDYSCQLPEGEAFRCDVERAATGRNVWVKVQVSEGPRVVVGEILVRGGFVTDEDTIREEVPLKEGAPFDYAKLLEGQSNLRSLRLFRSVRADLIGFAKGEERDRVGIVVVVEERDYLFVDFALGFETVSRSDETDAPLEVGLYGEASFIDQNVFGWGKQLALPVRLGNLEVSVTPTLSDPRFVGTRTHMDLSVTLAATNQRGADYLTIPLDSATLLGESSALESFNRFEVGSALGLRREFSLQTRGNLDFEVERVLHRQKGDDTKSLCLFGGDPEDCLTERDTTARLTPALTHDRRDSPLHPTRGYLLRGETRVGAILKKLDPLAKGFTQDQFVRTEGEVQTYRSFLGRRVVLASSLRLGLGLPLGTELRLPGDDLFTVGGAGTVRGLSDEGVTTPRNGFKVCKEKDLDPGSSNPDQVVEGVNCADKGGNHRAVFNVELRARMLWWFWAVVFYDAGVLVDALDEVREEYALRQSAGFGLRWLLLDQIPVRIDAAFPFDLPSHEETVPFHVAIGYPF